MQRTVAEIEIILRFSFILYFVHSECIILENWQNETKVNFNKFDKKFINLHQ